MLAPPPPRSPSRRARRLIFGYEGKQLVLLILGVGFLGLGTIFTLVFGSGAFVDLALDVAGEPCAAKVTAVEVDRNARINGRHPTEISFVCTVGGVTIESSGSTLNDELIASVRPGEQVGAEVIPSLSVGRLYGTTYSTFGYFGLFVLVFPITGGVLTWIAVRQNRGEIRAFVHGTAVIGRVVRRELDRSANMNGRHPWVVRWQFVVDGARYEGSLSNMDEAALENALPGDEIVVLFDPKDPAVNTAYIA